MKLHFANFIRSGEEILERVLDLAGGSREPIVFFFYEGCVWVACIFKKFKFFLFKKNIYIY